MRQECNRHVAVYFSIEEKAELARQLARQTQDLETLTDRKKQMSSEFKAKIDAANAEIFKIARFLNNGYEYRDVKCDVQLDIPRRGLKRIVRMDTGEIVEECPMTASELQDSLDFAMEKQVDEAADTPIDSPQAEPEAKEEPQEAKEKPAPPEASPAQADDPMPPVSEMPKPLSEPVRLAGSGDGWRAEIVIIETSAGFETEASMQFGANDALAVDGGSICAAESEAKEDAAQRLYRFAQKYYAEAHGKEKRNIRDLMAWAAERMPPRTQPEGPEAA